MARSYARRVTQVSRETASAPIAGLAPRALTLWAALVGIVSALVTLAIAEVVSLVLGAGEPVLAVGSLIIDLVPPGFKTLIIDLFGTADKLVLIASIAILLLVLSSAVGVLQLRRPPFGIALFGLVAVVAFIAAATRSDARFVSGIPTILGFIFGLLILRRLVHRLEEWRNAPRRSVNSAVAVKFTGTQFERRAFLRLVVVAGVTSVVVGAVARSMNAASAAVTQLRQTLRLPGASSAASILAPENTLTTEGISSWVTPTADFYRIDTALQVPAVDSSKWKLKISGMVENEIEIGFDELLALPLIERYVTLACVSNEVGGNLIGNAKWLGHPLRELLKRAVPAAGADMVLSTSVDGFTASTPLSVLQDEGTDAMLAVGMNGEPLPLDHGFPVRMVVPGLYGYVSATKWVVDLKVTTFAQDAGYWTSRGWTDRGPVKISSRIDTPTGNTRVNAGRIAVGGVAWHQHTGIATVEVKVDNGDWQQATLAKVVTTDSWLQWSYAWEATAGNHQLSVRATDSDGSVQTAAEAPPAPDGSTGLHTVQVQVG